MSQPQHISEIMLQIAANPNDSMGKALRRCPFIQAELIKQKKMNLNDLTDEQIDHLIEWDQNQQAQCTKK